MSKRDIKLKRWARRSAKRQMALEAEIVDGKLTNKRLTAWRQRRIMADGRHQFRVVVLFSRFTLRRMRRSMNLAEWCDQ